MKGLLDSNGSVSSTRVNMFLCTFTGCAVAIMAVYRGCDDLMGLGVLVTGIIGCGVGGKVIQKGKENV